MKKKLFVIFLAAALVLVIYGCSVTPSPTVNTNPATSTDSVPDTVPETTEEPLPWRPDFFSNYKHEFLTMEVPYEIKRQVLPETVDNPDGLPVLKWVCIVPSADPMWNEAAVVELNQMLADRELPYRVQFTILATSRHVYAWEDLYANPDIQKELVDADLIFGVYNPKDMEKWLLPITDYVYGDAQPSLSGALPHPLSWYGIEVNGEIYGIPQLVSPAYCEGWSVDADFMEKYGLTIDDFDRDFWEMDALFAEIYEKNGNRPFLNSDIVDGIGGEISTYGILAKIPFNEMVNSSAYQRICMCLAIDLQAENPTIVNLLETEHFSQIHDAVLRYQKAGYVTDRYVKGADGSYTINPDCVISYDESMLTSKPYLDEEQGLYEIPNTPMMLRKPNNVKMTGISAKSAQQEQALSLLAQIMTDEALRLQLCYGKEGRDYTLEGNIYTLTTQEDGSYYYMDFLSHQAIYFEFVNSDEEMTIRIRSTSPYALKYEGMTRLESIQANLSQASVCDYPAIFDYSVLDDELAALDEVLKAYYPMFTSAAEHYSEEYFQRMIRDMKEAGMDTIITELQRQLDAWIAEYPDWDPLS